MEELYKYVIGIVAGLLVTFFYKKWNKRKQYAASEREISLKEIHFLLEQVKKERDEYKSEAELLREVVSDLRVEVEKLTGHVNLVEQKLKAFEGKANNQF